MTGHILPSSRFALSLNPSVEYLTLNLLAFWKKQTTRSLSLQYAGIPYQVLNESDGALALIIACTRLAMVRSGSGKVAIFASTAPSPSVSTFDYLLTRSLIADFSSSVNPLDFLLVALVFFWDPGEPFWSGFMQYYSSSELDISYEFIPRVCKSFWADRIFRIRLDSQTKMLKRLTAKGVR